MTTVHHNSTFGDEERRTRQFAGDIFVHTALPGVLSLVEFAREMIEDAFAPFDPREAQYHMPVGDWVARFAPVKPAFIHHPRTLGILRQAVEEAACDPDATYIDVPRLRGVTSDGYLTSGVGYAHHPHRDTWYSAPMSQLNWWLPIYPFTADSAMAFHPAYWSTKVANGSSEFNYYEWNAVGRKQAASQVGADTRKQPRPTEPVALDPDLRIVCGVGDVIVFSAAHLHSTVANTSGLGRFSIDFRTVNVDDLAANLGAPNIDSQPTGTSLRDFRRGSDLEPMPDDLVASYDQDEPIMGVAVFRP